MPRIERGLPPPFYAAFLPDQRHRLKPYELTDAEDSMKRSIHDEYRSYVSRYMSRYLSVSELQRIQRIQRQCLSQWELIMQRHTYVLRGWGGGAIVTFVYNGHVDVSGGSVMAVMRAVASLAFKPRRMRRGLSCQAKGGERPRLWCANPAHVDGKNGTLTPTDFRHCSITAMCIDEVEQPSPGVYDLSEDVGAQRHCIKAQVFRDDGLLHVLLTAHRMKKRAKNEAIPKIYLPDAYIHYDAAHVKETPLATRDAKAWMRTGVSIETMKVPMLGSSRSKMLRFDPPLVHLAIPNQECGTQLRDDGFSPHLEMCAPSGVVRCRKLTYTNRRGVEALQQIDFSHWWQRGRDHSHQVVRMLPAILVDLGDPWRDGVTQKRRSTKKWRPPYPYGSPYPEELRHIQTVISLVEFVAHSRARRIQRAWRRAISDPSYQMCQRRLMREWNDSSEIMSIQ